MSQNYEIRVEGTIDETWSSWFDGLELTSTPNGSTLIQGAIEDQAALHGILMKIRDLGLALISVTRQAG